MNLLNTLLAIPTTYAQSVNAGEIASKTEGQLTQLVTYVISQIPLWITAFIVVILTFIVARMVKNAVENKMATEGIEEEHREVAILAARTANAVVLIIGITVALKIAGIDLTAIIAAGAFGVGFALQDIIMNFIAGIMILSSRHYTIGDIIKVNGTMGKIVEIQTRATILKAFDGTKIVVPNSVLFKNQVTSVTSNPFRRIELIHGVNYDEDLTRTAKIALEAVKATKGILAAPKPKILFYEWGDYSINFKVWAWVDSHSAWLKTRHQMLVNINKALSAANVNIPYPIQTIEVADAEKEEQKLLEEFERREKEEVKATPAKAPAPAPVAIVPGITPAVAPQPYPSIELSPTPATIVPGITPAVAPQPAKSAPTEPALAPETITIGPQQPPAEAATSIKSA